MKYYFGILAFVFVSTLMLASCNKPKDGTPDCIVENINSFDNDSNCDDIKVDKYTFQGGDVYVFEPGTCGNDMTSEVMDENCVNLGYLGGIAGNQEINGEDFSNAVFIENVWKK